MEVNINSFFVDDLFKGFSETSGGKFKKRCESLDGTVKGLGPRCNHDEEAGRKEIYECYFSKTHDCIVTYTDASWSCVYYEPCSYDLGGWRTRDDCIDEATLRACQRIYSECHANSPESDCNCMSCSCWINFHRDVLVPYERECQEQSNACSESLEEQERICKETNPYHYCPDRVLKEYEECILDLADVCECKHCEHGGPKKNTKDPNDTSSDKTAIDPEDKLPSISTMTSNSNYGVIPRVWGRYVVPGNVIWLGNQRDQEITVLQVDGPETMEYVTTMTKIDFLVGLCIGPMEGISRVWLNDVLIYNNTLTLTDQTVDLMANSGATDLNVTALVDSDYNLSRLQYFKPTLEMFSGGDAQAVASIVAEDVGYGKAPAHRGLTTVLFKDLDVELLKASSFPKFRFEVYSTEVDELDPVITSPTRPVDGDNPIVMDTRTRLVYAKSRTDSNVLNVFNGDTLDHVMDCPIEDDFIISKTGNVFTGDKIVNTFTGQHAIIIPDVDLSYCSNSVINYDPAGNMYELVILHDKVTGNTMFTNINTATWATTFIQEHDVTEAYAMTHSVIVSGTDNTVYCVQLGLKDDALVVIGNQVLNYNNTLLEEFVVTETLLSLDSPHPDDYIALVYNTIANDGLVIVFGSGHVIKISLFPSPVIVWSTVLDTEAEIPANSFSTYVYDDLFVVDAESVIFVVDTLTGEPYFYKELISPIRGGYYYDYYTKSIIYGAPESNVRVFLDRDIPEKVPVDRILTTLAEQLGVTDLFKVKLTTIPYIDGFMLDYRASVIDLYTSLSELYQLAVIDNGEYLTIINKAESTYEEVITKDTAIDFNTRSNTLDSLLSSVTLTFVGIDGDGLYDQQQTVTINPDLEILDNADLPLALKILDDPDNVRIYLEKVLANKRAESSTLSLAASSKHLALTPQDCVTTDAYTSYRIGNLYITPEFTIGVDSSEYDNTVDEYAVSLQAATMHNSTYKYRPTKHPVYRPVVLFHPAIHNDDIGKTLSAQEQIVMTGLEAPTINIDPTEFSFRVGESPIYNTATHIKALHSGVVLRQPESLLPAQYITDTVSRLVVRFDHQETLPMLASNRLLIVGMEYIVFDQYEIINDTDVEFTVLSRGQYNTDIYIENHGANERVYLYTEDTFAKASINPMYSLPMPVAKAFYKTALPAGAINMSYLYQADAGNLRTPAPSVVGVYNIWGSDTVKWEYRRPQEVNNIDNCGALPDVYTSIYGEYKYLFVVTERQLSVEEFNEIFVRQHRLTLTDGLVLYSSIVYTNNAAINLPSDKDLTEDTVYVIVAQLSYDERIVGFPRFHTVVQGVYPPED